MINALSESTDRIARILIIFCFCAVLEQHYAIGQQLDPFANFKLEDLDLDQTHWYGIYIGGQKSGFMSSRFEKRNRDGRSTLGVVTKTEMKVLAYGQTSTMTSHEDLEFEAKKPFLLVSGFSESKSQDQVLRVDATVNGGTLDANIFSSGTRRTQRLSGFHYSLPEHSSFELLDLKNAKVGSRFSFRQFSIESLEFDPQLVTITRINSSSVGGIAFRFFEAKVNSRKHQVDGKFRFDESSHMISCELGGMFELREEPEKSARNYGYSADLAVLGQLKINSPLGDSKRVRSLELKIDMQLAQLLDGNSPRQRWFRQGNMYVLRLGDYAKNSTAASSSDITENLRETVEYPINHPEIKQLAARAVAGETKVEKQIDRLLNFVSGYISLAYNEHSLTALDVAKRRRGDCSEHAMLFAALARALKIPARTVGGYVYLGDDTRGFGAHAWNEVIVNGNWRSVDAMWKEKTINATHIKLKSENQLLNNVSQMQLLRIERR